MTTKPRTLAHHPVADLFPMLTDDELTEMAEDIKQRGLLHPIVRDSEGRILDGRNRYDACGRAGVEPTFETYDGDDPAGYALAVNITRRHLTKSQQAMIAARARDHVFSKNMRDIAAENKISPSRIAYASTVLQYAPELADAVVAGTAGLNDAYQTARERKTAADSDESQLARLREEDPELADRVVESEGKWSLAAAWAELKERRKLQERDRQAGRDAAARLLATLKTEVSSIAIAVQLGEKTLVTDEIISGVRDAADLLQRLSKEET